MAMPVVMKRVGRRKTRAMPTQKTMKTTAARRARMSAAMTAKMATDIVSMKKRPRGKPERAMWEARKAWEGSLSESWYGEWCEG